ncbi:MAG TPA: site-specific integrase [Nocardioidaceae bacterium]
MTVASAPSGGTSFAAFVGAWLTAVQPSLRPGTWRRYEQYARLHAVPALGHLPLCGVTPMQLQLLYAERLAAGCSPTSVRHLHRFLHRVFADAVRWRAAPNNPVEQANPPRVRRHEIRPLTAEQARRLLAGARGDRREALYVVALTTGMRQGELLALRWADVDLAAGRLAVRGSLHRDAGGGWTIQEPKTARSRRPVVLAPVAVRALAEHRHRQDAERRAAGARWEDTDFVFTNRVGRPLSSQNLVQRDFHPLLRRLGLPRVRFHDLRHTAATLLLQQGVHPKVVSEMLGHADVGVTLDIYSHVSPALHEAAAFALGALLDDRQGAAGPDRDG